MGKRSAASCYGDEADDDSDAFDDGVKSDFIQGLTSTLPPPTFDRSLLDHPDDKENEEKTAGSSGQLTAKKIRRASKKGDKTENSKDKKNDRQKINKSKKPRIVIPESVLASIKIPLLSSVNNNILTKKTFVPPSVVNGKAAATSSHSKSAVTIGTKEGSSALPKTGNKGKTAAKSSDMKGKEGSSALPKTGNKRKTAAKSRSSSPGPEVEELFDPEETASGRFSSPPEEEELFDPEDTANGGGMDEEANDSDEAENTDKRGKKGGSTLRCHPDCMVCALDRCEWCVRCLSNRRCLFRFCERYQAKLDATSLLSRECKYCCKVFKHISSRKSHEKKRQCKLETFENTWCKTCHLAIKNMKEKRLHIRENPGHTKLQVRCLLATCNLYMHANSLKRHVKSHAEVFNYF